MAGHCVAQFLPGVAAIGKVMAQPREALAYRLEHIDGTVPVLNIGRIDEDEDQKATGVGEDVPLATLDLLIPTCGDPDL